MRSIRFFYVTIATAFGCAVVMCSITLYSAGITWTGNPVWISRVELFYKCKTCDSGIALAREHFKKAKYQIIFWGLIESSLIIELGNVLLHDYNIQPINGGCVEREEMECYNAEMKILLESKFGSCYYEDALRRAKENLAR